MSTIPAGIAVSLSILAIVVPGIARAQIAPPTEAPAAANRLEAVELETDSNVFQSSGLGSPNFRRQRERLLDPEQRALMRAEARTHISASHQDIGGLLQIDPATEHKLIELLTDQQMGDHDQFFASMSARPSPDPWPTIIAQAQRETAKVQALRELLGQQKLERYQAFAPLVNEHRQVAKLDERLAPAHKLNFEQKQRMAELWRDLSRSDIERTRFSIRAHSPFRFEVGQPMPSAEEMQRKFQLMTIAAYEESWRRMPKLDAEMKQRAAEFLTPPQLEVLAQMNKERAELQRQLTEGARLKAGLSAEIPEQPEVATPPSPMPRAGDVKVAVKLIINGGEETHFTDTVRNGKSVTFRCREGLFVEVRPTMFDNDMFDLRVFYYEPDSRGVRRLIGEGGQMGQYIPGNDGGGLGGKVITGNQGYAVRLSAIIEPV